MDPKADDPGHGSYEFTLPHRKVGELHDDRPAPEIKIPPIDEEKMEEHQEEEENQGHKNLARGLVGKFVDEFGNVLDWDGTVLGCVQGDLPSMVGRPVSESGKIMDADGDVVGHVSENHTLPQLRELDSRLRADEDGNIYDEKGDVVGKLNPTKEQESEDQNQEGKSSRTQTRKAKASSAPSPSEVYLDVKSTHDGIQLIIKIPTVFNPDK